jgi:thiamine biosynthesis lipoprotein
LDRAVKYSTRSIVILVSLALAAALAWAMLRFADRLSKHDQNGPPKIIAVGGRTMGTTWSVKLIALPPNKSRQQLQDEVAALLRRLDDDLSDYKPDSALSRFNRSRGDDWFGVPADLAEVTAASLRASEETNGAFDITVAPLVELWGFGPSGVGKEHHVPTDAEIDAARKHVGWRLLECRENPPALRKHDLDLHIDLGGIGKGYAADKVGEYLDAAGVKDYLIAVGGELRARGTSRPGQRGWRVGIEAPAADVRRVLRTLDLVDGSLSTSGDYRNFLLIDGRWFCHEIDPRTGRAMERGHGPAAVSILDPSGTRADALATALIVLGDAEGYDLANRFNVSALFITRGGDKFDQKGTGGFAGR